jgi:hypothetical protein
MTKSGDAKFQMHQYQAEKNGSLGGKKMPNAYRHKTV